LPTHWLGRADWSLLEPAPIEPEPLVLPPTLGLVVELPLPVLPEVCAHEAPARPSSAAATAAVSVLVITLCTP
jgi:hypothetical protein